jgi:Uma2 family endonuclease
MEPVVLKFPHNTQFTDDALFEFCVANKELRIERDENGQIIIMPPTGGMSGNRNFKVNTLFGKWVAANEHLGYGFDSSTGFRLPSKAMRAPDVAWVRRDRWEKLRLEDQEKFPPLTPDFIIEIRSNSDSLQELKQKMLEWIANGCRLAWLIDPLEQKAYVYTANGLAQTIDSFDGNIDGGDVLPGFQLELSVLK